MSAYAESEEEARKVISEKLGHEDFQLVQLPHAQLKDETLKLEKLSEEVAGELFRPSSKKMMRVIHELGM